MGVMSEEKKVEQEGPRPWNGFQDDKQPLTDHRIWEIADLVWRRKSITTDRGFELDFAHEVIAAALHEARAASTSANGDRFDPYRLKVADECCERLMSACTDAGCPDGVRMDDWIRENIRSTSTNVAQGAEAPCLACVSNWPLHDADCPDAAPPAQTALTDDARDSLKWAADRAHIAALGKPIDGVEGLRWRTLRDLLAAAQSGDKS
jgi:hypothetical protein